MIDLIWFFLVGILGLGIITSYEDIKHGKIRNKWIIAGLVYVFLVYVGLIGYSFLNEGFNSNYLIEFGTNFLFAILVGFGLWLMKIWTAGDGKLFIAYVGLIPLGAYVYGMQKWVPSISLLINIFLIGLVFMMCSILYNARLKDFRKVIKVFLKDFFQPKGLIESAVYLFSIFWIVILGLRLIGINNYFLNLFITILIYSWIKKKLKAKTTYIMLSIGILRLFIDKSIYSWNFLISFLILIFIWRLFRGFFIGGVSMLGKELFSKEINVDKLKPGMILSEPIKELENDDMESEGLTKQQINKIKDAGLKKIKISQTIAFAPFIFAGVLLTILVKGNILIVIMNLIRLL